MANTDVVVGSVGTVYFVPTWDADLTPANFDPTLAATKQLIFKMPGNDVLITRTAVAAQQLDKNGNTVWGLRYTVVAADVAAYSSPTAGGFHQEEGTITIEAYVEFGADQKWPSSTITRDQKGRVLKVKARLSA